MRSLTAKTQARAKQLRHNLTPAERKLWNALRNRSLEGFKFLRQAPVDPYIADFLCREAMLIVEVDGATHSTDRQHAHDRRRAAVLEAKGYRLLHVQNPEVHGNFDGVIDAILIALKTPHPPRSARHPLPRAGEG